MTVQTVTPPLRDRISIAMAALRGEPKAVLPQGTAAITSNQLPERVGKPSVKLFRHWAEHSEWVRGAIGTRKSQVSQSEWDIGPFDPDKDHPVRLANELREMFKRPNPKDGDFRTFIEQVVEDLLVLDAGSAEIVPSLIGRPVEIWPVDGGDIKVSRDWDGDDDENRYFWYPNSALNAVDAWKNDEFIYMMQNPRTYTPVGLSPLETLKMTIDAELGGTAYNKRQVEGAAPDGMVDLGEGVRPEKVDEFKNYWNLEVAGKGAMAFIGGTKNAKFIQFRQSNRDQQFKEWLEYLVRKIAVVFMMSPQDLGMAFDINRSTSEVLSEQSEDRGLRPLLGLIQSMLTQKVVWHPAFGGPANNLAFTFTRLNMKESLNRASINEKALAGMPWKTINEARREDGREPIGPEYDKLMANTSQGLVTLEDIPSARETAEAKQPTDRGGGDGRSDGSDPARPTSKSTDQD